MVRFSVVESEIWLTVEKGLELFLTSGFNDLEL
jgi:hypothetical protein